MKNIAFRSLAAGLFGLTAALAGLTAAQAQDTGRYAAPGDQFYHEPTEKPQGLRFANFEASMARDPLTWSSDPGWQLHRTPAGELTEATDTLRAAIPTGTPAAEAAALLHKAGADCAPVSGPRLVCRYRAAQTPYGGEYFDDVLWRVWADVADGRVGNIVLTRDWSRP